MRKLLLLIAFWTCTSSLFSQPKEFVDSLINTIDQIEEDTLMVQRLANIAFFLKFQDQERAYDYAHQAIKMAENIDFPKGKAIALNNLGILNDIQGNSDSAYHYFLWAADVAEAAGSERHYANVMNNLGMFNWNRGYYKTAIDKYLNALRVYEEIGYTPGYAIVNSNIGLIFQELGQYEKALEYNLAALKTRKELGQDYELPISYNNIGICYMRLKDYGKAEDYLREGIDFSLGQNEKHHLAQLYHTYSSGFLGAPLTSCFQLMKILPGSEPPL